MTLTEFLLARIAETEAAARSDDPFAARFQLGLEIVTVAAEERILAECEAKRRVVKAYESVASERSAYVYGLQLVAKYLAAVYADHEDYRDEWRP